MIRREIKLISGLALLVILMAVGMAQGADLRVCDCRACGCQYLSIQEAIERASPGDTVLVRSGYFHGNVNVSKPIILRGEKWHGGDIPLIDADGNGSCITVSADGATVKNMRVTNSGNESGNAGIRVVSNGSTISDNIASENGGSGIILEGATNCTVYANVATNNSFGIALLGSEENLLFNNRLFNNTEDAFDDGQNRWDDGLVGNYYGTFNCTDENNDTICDSAYNISGGASVDALAQVG
ncbi:right-handed parallel beta-helix repeat-containing protein [Methanocrinis sp.]|uniref:right-handed parallel beta-helix repeat-containing protein n=1 Tax=Methanocrinis sp. TaxID=3101522 RepID=UPI003D112858